MLCTLSPVPRWSLLALCCFVATTAGACKRVTEKVVEKTVEVAKDTTKSIEEGVDKGRKRGESLDGALIVTGHDDLKDHGKISVRHPRQPEQRRLV